MCTWIARRTILSSITHHRVGEARQDVYVNFETWLRAMTLLQNRFWDANNTARIYHIQCATPVKNLLFLARLEFLCKTGCVPHYFQYNRGHILLFSPKSQYQIIDDQILNICRVLYVYIAIMWKPQMAKMRGWAVGVGFHLHDRCRIVSRHFGLSIR